MVRFVMKLLFSGEGRINRAQFWLGQLLNLAFLAPVVLPVLALVYDVKPFAAWLRAVDHSSNVNEPLIGALIALVVVVGFGLVMGFVWASFMLGTKRYHDIGKSGAWVLINFVPFIGPIWYWIETGCRPGTKGQNIYGPDPRATKL